MYSGVFRDVYGEFMIQVNEEYLSFRGEIKHTHALTHSPISSLPLSAGFENEILAGQTEEKMDFITAFIA